VQPFASGCTGVISGSFHEAGADALVPAIRIDSRVEEKSVGTAVPANLDEPDKPPGVERTDPGERMFLQAVRPGCTSAQFSPNARASSMLSCRSSTVKRGTSSITTRETLPLSGQPAPDSLAGYPQTAPVRHRLPTDGRRRQTLADGPGRTRGGDSAIQRGRPNPKADTSEKSLPGPAEPQPRTPLLTAP
jgi:hypothetical protein